MGFTRLSKQQFLKLQQKHGAGITQGLLAEIFRYREDGNLLRQNTSGGWSVAGSMSEDGYSRTKVCGKLYLTHRLIWILVKGTNPVDELDHEDHDTANNRIGNLREADRFVNMKNCSLSKNNTSGCNGVSWMEKSGKWRAYIRLSGSNRQLGVYTGLFEAAAARKSAEITAGFHQNHGK